jgi:hypothetical protein
MEEVYLEDSSVLQQHLHPHQQASHPTSSEQQHPHLADTTLNSVHMDQGQEVPHDVYTIEHDSLGVANHQGQGDVGVSEIDLQGGQDGMEHLGEVGGEHHHHHHHHQHHLDLDSNQVSIGQEAMPDVGQAGYNDNNPLAGLGEIEKPRISHNRNPIGRNQHGNPGASLSLRYRPRLVDANLGTRF